MAGVIVLDASVLIAYPDGAHTHHAAAEAQLSGAVDDDLGANLLTLAEVLVVPAGDGRLKLARTALADPEVDEPPYPGGAAAGLAQLRASTGLKMPDCCVLLAARDADATVASFDARLLHAAEDGDLSVLGG